MLYKKLVGKIEAARLPGLLWSLNVCTDDEAAVLQQKFGYDRQEALLHARDIYAAEIVSALELEILTGGLSPEDILDSRRAANVWAIAQILRRNRVA